MCGRERRLRSHIAKVARTDPLTGLPNRRALEEALRRFLQDGREDHSGLAVLIVDVDRFKRYNDQFGHLAADGVLEQIGSLLASAVREGDMVARYGGDEFVVLAPALDTAQALELAERVRLQVARTGLCTVSVGVCGAEQGVVTADALLDAADAALLTAKEGGRNCVRAPALEVGRAA